MEPCACSFMGATMQFWRRSCSCCNRGLTAYRSRTSDATAPQSLAWTRQLHARRGKTLIALELASSATERGMFEVPAAECPAQTLELKGRAQDMPQESDVRIGPLSLERVGS
jgi:hypothetical protein